MKRFLSAVALCAALLIFGLCALLPKTHAEKNLLQNLLNLPAPAPPNPFVVKSRMNRDADFYSKSNLPGDDASTEDILAYWQMQSQSFDEQGYNAKPTPKQLEKILAEIEEKPERLTDFLNALPDDAATADLVKRYYDRADTDDKFSEDWKSEVKEWLTFHSNYFSDDLLKAARTVGDANGYVTNQDELLALAHVDWDKAQSIVQRLYADSSQPISQTLARWVLYRHALETDSTGDIDRYRDELKATVENKSYSPGMRDLAMDALVHDKDWEGRDDWYLSLLGDETLADLRANGTRYTGLTTLILHSPPEKYVGKMLELVKSDNRAVRGAAIRNLALVINDKNPEIIRALLPWLEDPNWVEETNGERRNLINALQRLQIPESVPGLIAVLNEKETREISSGNALSNVSLGNTMLRANGEPTEVYPYRSEAIQALTTQKDMRAANPLRLILPQVEEWQRGNVVRALLASKGFSIPEQIEALELIAKNYRPSDEIGYAATGSNVMASNMPVVKNMSVNTVSIRPPREGVATVTGNVSVGSDYDYVTNAGRQYNPADIKPMLASQLVSIQEPDEELVAAVIDRINTLDAKEPQMAQGLRQILKNWHGPAINALMLRDLKADKSDTDSVVKLLSLRKELRETQSSEVYDARGGTATAVGVTACILEDPNNYHGILEGKSDEAKIALFACGRLIRAALPVRAVAENLRSPNQLLVLAAERYLESEDSPEARTIVLSMHPNEAKILGAKSYFGEDGNGMSSSFLPALFQTVNESAMFGVYYDTSEKIDSAEKKLQKEVKENQELFGVYAYDENYIRIYKDRAVFSWEEDPARYRERELTKEEFDRVKNYLASERAENLPPFLSDCSGEGDCEPKELLMLGRQGGRRVYVRGGDPPKFFAGLDEIFKDLRQPHARLHYWLEKNINGLEILFDDKNLQAEAVWKTGDDFRVLLNDAARRKQIDKELQKQEENEENSDSDKETDYDKIEAAQRKRREQRQFENYAWYKFAGGKLNGFADQPPPFEFMPKQDGSSVRAEQRSWKARGGAVEIRAGETDGLYKITRGQIVKMREGFYGKPVVTPNGRWVIATAYSEDSPHLVRINLLTNKETSVKIDSHPIFETVGFVPSLGKVLVFGGSYRDYEGEDDEDVSESEGDYYLLDAETGAVQKATGEMRPLAQQTFRPLQPTGAQDEFWAAIPDVEKNETEVGVYNAKTSTFKSMLKIPQINFNSMKMWVDGGKVFFVYQGHLLALPLPK